jgi:hypothetical protein
MDRQGAGDVFLELASGRGGPRIATFGIRKFGGAGFDGFEIRKIVGGIGIPESPESSPQSRMRLAQRRA